MAEGKRSVGNDLLIHPFPEGNIMLCIPISNSLLVNHEDISPENFEKNAPLTQVSMVKKVSAYMFRTWKKIGNNQASWG